ncbi:MAG: HAD family hydrolase, partial [Desulfotomaculaceae bacterium]|nr:HAD family hydrolase [Desulfotomaculaceae bacterium]
IEGQQDMCYDCYKQQAPTVCVDFDGVLAQYDGWRGPDHLGKPMPKVGDFLADLNSLGYRVVVLTTRQPFAVTNWLIRHKMAGFVDTITNTKPPAKAYIDDRGICFRGDFSEVVAKLRGFKPWWGKGQ